jgi:glyoxylase-like metal-dependent hydrolase (beta-lactamase superfamily II)
LTDAGDVIVVPPPGHSPGHVGVLVEDGDHTVLLAGDSSYTLDALLKGIVDGVGPDEKAERVTHERIRAHASAHPTVYLVAHAPKRVSASRSGASCSRQERTWPPSRP